ncbi:MAG: nucleotidyltransferase family protein [Pseudomonadota bacterium]
MNETQFIEHALQNFVNSEILARLPELGVKDGWLVSGGLFQTVWNVLTYRDVTHGIKDYDVFYFDPDPSWEAEDTVMLTVITP